MTDLESKPTDDNRLIIVEEQDPSFDTSGLPNIVNEVENVEINITEFQTISVPLQSSISVVDPTSIQMMRQFYD